MSKSTSPRCAVFASGGGSNFQALIDRIASKDLHATIALCISNNSAAGALERAQIVGIPTLHCTQSQFTDPAAYTRALLAALKNNNIEYIILAGYMKMIPREVIATYRNRIVNIHPALLPAFGGKGMYGHYVHEAVIAYGARITGVTVHLVDEEYDHGSILMQQSCQVLDTDTPQSLAARVLAVEHDTYWRAIEGLVNESIVIEGRKVRYLA